MYPVDNAIQRLNNRGLNVEAFTLIGDQLPTHLSWSERFLLSLMTW